MNIWPGLYFFQILSTESITILARRPPPCPNSQVNKWCVLTIYGLPVNYNNPTALYTVIYVIYGLYISQESTASSERQINTKLEISIHCWPAHPVSLSHPMVCHLSSQYSGSQHVVGPSHSHQKSSKSAVSYWPH